MDRKESINDKKKFISDHKILKIDDMPKLLENFTVENVSIFLKTNPGYIDRPDKKTGSTLLYRSIMIGANDVTEFLLSLKANPDIPNINGETPLYLSVEESNYKIINLLLEAGANPNIHNQDGETPMHVAAFKGDYKVIKLLLLFGANPFIRTTKSKYTPLDYAKEKNKLKCIEVLEPIYADDEFDNNFKNKFINRGDSKENINETSQFKSSASSSYKMSMNSLNKNLNDFGKNQTTSSLSKSKVNLSNGNDYYFYQSNTNSNQNSSFKIKEPSLFKSDSKKIDYNSNNYENQIIDSINKGSLTSKNSNFQLYNMKNQIDFTNPVNILPNNNLTTKHSKIPNNNSTNIVNNYPSNYNNNYKKNHNRNYSVCDTKRKPPTQTNSKSHNEEAMINIIKNPSNIEDLNNILERINSHSNRNIYTYSSDQRNNYSYEKNNIKKNNENFNELISCKSICNNNLSPELDKKNYTTNQTISSNLKFEFQDFDSFRNDSKFNNMTSRRKTVRENKIPTCYENNEIENINNNKEKSLKKKKENLHNKITELEKFENALLRENSRATQISEIPKNFDDDLSKINENLCFEKSKINLNNSNCQSNDNSFRESNSFIKNMNNFEEKLEKMKIDFIKKSTEQGKGLSANYENYIEAYLNPKNNNNPSLFKRESIGEKSENIYEKKNSELKTNSSNFYNINNLNSTSFNSKSIYVDTTNKSLVLKGEINDFQPISTKNLFAHNTTKNNSNNNLSNLNLGLNIKVDVITTPETALILSPLTNENENFNNQVEISKDYLKVKDKNSNVNFMQKDIDKSENKGLQNNLNELKISKQFNQTPNFCEIEEKNRDFTQHLKIKVNKNRQMNNKNLQIFKKLNNDLDKDDNASENNQFEDFSRHNGNIDGFSNPRHQKNFTLFNNNFTNSKNFIDENELEEEKNLNADNNKQTILIPNKKNIQKRNSYNECLNINNNLNAKLNMNLDKISYKYLNINLNKNREKNSSNEKQQINESSKVINSKNNNNDLIRNLKENSKQIFNNFNNEKNVNNQAHLINLNKNGSMNVVHNKVFNKQLTNHKLHQNHLNRYPSKNNFTSTNDFSKLSEFEINRIDSDENVEQNIKNFTDDETDELNEDGCGLINNFDNYDSRIHNNSFSNNNYLNRNDSSYNRQIKDKLDKSIKIPIDYRNTSYNNNSNCEEPHFPLSNHNNLNNHNNKVINKSKWNNKNMQIVDHQNPSFFKEFEIRQDNNNSEIGSEYNFEDRLVTLKPTEYLDTQENKSINTRITYDSTLHPSNIEDFYYKDNLLIKQKNRNYSYLSSRVNENFWQNIENKHSKKNHNKIPISNSIQKKNFDKKLKNNKNSISINNVLEEIQDSKEFEKNLRSNRILCQKNKDRIFNDSNNSRNECNFNINTGYYTSRKKSVNNNKKEYKSNNKDFKKLKKNQNPLKEYFQENEKELAIFFSSKNDINYEDNKENILNYNNSQNYINKFGETINNENEEEYYNNNINNVSNGNFIQETFNNNDEEKYTRDTNRMIQRRKIKYFSKSNKSLKEEFKQISLDTQALDESLKNLDSKKNPEQNRNFTTTSNNSHLNTNLTKANSKTHNSIPKYVSLMNEKGEKSSKNQSMSNKVNPDNKISYDENIKYLLNQDELIDELSQNFQEDNQVYCNNSYLEFENDQYDSCLKTLDRNLNNKNSKEKNSNKNSLYHRTNSIYNNSKKTIKESNNKYQESYRNDKKLELKDLAAETSNILETDPPLVSEQYAEMQHFLRMIYLDNYTNLLIKNGFDDINILINQIKNSNAINDKMLKDIGISVPGYRAKILIKLEEKAQLFNFDIPSVAFYSVGDPAKIKSSHILNDTNIKGIFSWLAGLKLEKYTKNFILSGYNSMELLLIQMASK